MADRIRVEYGVGWTEPTYWVWIATVEDVATVRIPPGPSGVRVWIRARTERPGYRPSAWTTSVYTDVGADNPALYALSATIAPDGTPTVIWTENPITLGLTLEYSIEATGLPPTYGSTQDVDAAPGHYAFIGTTVDDGETFHVRATPYTGFGGGSVSGTAGTARTASAEMDEAPVGSGFSSGFSTGYGS